MARELWEQVDADLYQVLGVETAATTEEITLAWRSTAKRLHPDRGGDIDSFQKAEIAYQVLSNPVERGRYDRTRVRQQRYVYAGSSPSAPRYYWVNPNFGTYRTQPAEDMSGPAHTVERRRRNPWFVALLVLLSIVAVVAAVLLSLVTFVVLFALAILAVGRFLNPDRDQSDQRPRV